MLIVIPTKFPLGQIVATAHAVDTDSPETIHDCLARHASGDWGNLCDEDNRSNENALRVGSRLFSSYEITEKGKLWIITEWDRSITTILLPSEY